MHGVDAALLRCGLLGLLVLVGSGCRRTTPGAGSPEEELEERPDHESWDVDYQLREDGRPRLRLRAGYMARFEETDSTYSLLRPRESRADSFVRSIWYDEGGNRVATMRSDRLYFYDDEQRMRAVGSVVAITPEGNRLETERLVWRERSRTVRAPGFVRMRQEGDWVEGYGLVADEAFEEYTLSDPTGRVRIDEQAPEEAEDES